MYSAPVTNTGPGAKALWSLAAICCLMLVALALAATIVLALIPLYLPKNTVASANNSASDSQSFYIQYSADTSLDSSATGTVLSGSQIGSSLGLNDDGSVEGSNARVTMDRRRRSLLNPREKRTVQSKFSFKCRPKFLASCFSDACRLKAISKLKTKIQKVGNIANFPMQIYSGGAILSFTYSLIFVGFSSTAPAGFGEVTSFIFIAINSGAFTDPLTWSNGIVPYGSFSVIIPVGITVTLARAALEIRMKTCDVYGALVLGSGYSTFTFYYPPNLIIRSGGKCQDLTTDKKIYIPPSSLITLHPGGAFAAAGTVLQAYSSLPAASSLGASVTVPTSGPFTCGILPNGNLLSFNKVTYIVTKSGGFTSGATFLGGIAPSADICTLVGGCGIYVPAGYTLSTADLNGVLNMKIDIITIAAGGKLQLGTPGSSSGFRFSFSIRIDNSGEIEFVGSGGSIYIPTGSSINFLDGSDFISGVSISILVFNPITGLNIDGAVILLGKSLLGPYYITISSTGIISISIIGPGGASVTSTGITDVMGSTGSG